MSNYEMFANDELWDKTSCPFETQVLNQEAYDRTMNEVYGLEEELTVANIGFVKSNKLLYVDMSWEDDDEPFDHLVESIIYAYKGYVYHVNMCYTDQVAGFTMTREPQFNKNYRKKGERNETATRNIR